VDAVRASEVTITLSLTEATWLLGVLGRLPAEPSANPAIRNAVFVLMTRGIEAVVEAGQPRDYVEQPD